MLDNSKNSVFHSALLFALFALVADARAQGWTVEPNIAIGADYNDNPRLVEDGTEESVSGGTLDISAAFRRQTETSEFSVNPRANVRRYSDNDADAEDFYLDISTERRSPKSRWSLDLNASQVQVIRGELTDAEFDDTGVDDVQTGTGQIQDRQQRTLLRFRPQATFNVTERMSWFVDASYIDVGYDSQVIGSATDYSDGRIQTGFQFSTSERGSIRLTLFGSEYESGDNLNETSSYGALLRYQHAVTESTYFYAEAGYQDSDIEFPGLPLEDVSESATVWGIGGARDWTRTSLRIAIQNIVTPSGSGFLTERQRNRVTLDHKLSPRWDLRIAFLAQDTDTLASDSTLSDRDYSQGRITLAYRLAPKWSILGSTSYTYQDYATSPGDSRSRQANLDFVFHPRRVN